MEWVNGQDMSHMGQEEAVSECAATTTPESAKAERRWRRSRPSLSLIVAVALVSAMVGGLVVAAIAPRYMAANVASNQAQPVQFPGAVTGPAAFDVSPAVQVANKLSPSVVGITNKAVAGYDFFGRAYTEDRSGSGVIFDSNGYIVTNNHVIEGSRELKVFLSDGRVLDGTVVGADPPTDVAVVKVNAQGLPAAEFGDSDALKIGELAVAIGNPLGMEFKSSVTQGVISGKDRTLQIGEQTFRLIQTDAVINPGNSGGPLANAAGQVIGINTIKIESAEGMGFAIPINTVRGIINELLSKGRVARPWLGITLIDKPTAQKYGYDIALDKGIYVVDVIAGGPAARAGIRKDDIMEALDGKEITDASALKAILSTHRVGDTVAATVRRGSKALTIQIVLGEMPK
ncbi:MAG: S1C family serine protease [Ignavibacteriales bacterium]